MKRDEAEALARKVISNMQREQSAVALSWADVRALCDHILSGDHKCEITHDEDSTLVTKMARAIWKQMNFRGGDPTR